MIPVSIINGLFIMTYHAIESLIGMFTIYILEHSLPTESLADLSYRYMLSVPAENLFCEHFCLLRVLFSPSSVLRLLLLGVFLHFKLTWLFLELSCSPYFMEVLNTLKKVKLILLSKDKLFLLFYFSLLAQVPAFCELHSYSSIYPPSHAY